MIVHQQGCTLYSVHWLRHAVSAAGLLAQEDPDTSADRVSVEALADTLARFAEQDDWESVTLKDVADHATLMNQDKFRGDCTCGAFGNT